MLYRIDHEHLDRAFRRLQLQSELFLDCGEERRRVRIGRGRVLSGGAADLTTASLDGEVQLEVPAPVESRAIDDHASCLTGERLSERANRQASELDSAS